MGTVLASSLIASVTTFGIVAALRLESIRFFQSVSPFEFLFGTNWSPQTAIRADQVGSSGAFGAVPLFWGTIFIGAIIAMIVAIPLGRSEEHTSELQSLMRISYAVFCLKKKNHRLE